MFHGINCRFHDHNCALYQHFRWMTSDDYQESNITTELFGLGFYKYDRRKLWLMINRFPDMDPYFMEINHVLLASRGYEYDGFLFS
jgi:hypothetical protein